MPVVSFEPAVGLLRLQDSLDRLLRRPTGTSLFGPSRPSVFPPLNVFSDDDGLVIRAEIPGFKPEEIDVNVERRRLTISGNRERTDFGDDQGSYHRRERQTGRFSRALQLPENLEPSQASAECRNGILIVRIPKQPEHKPHRVKITQG